MADINMKSGLYSGRKRKIVMAFDIGTTFSGISYSILDPGQVPEIRGVTRFPAHEQVNGASKIPTVMYYNRGGEMVAAGAEAIKEGIYEIASDENWVKTEWFKLHVRSQRGTTVQLEDMLPPLPPNKTVVQVLADFMRYLHNCAKDYIQNTHVNGRDLWASCDEDIDYVLTHPNGWEGYQQSQMRDAAILAGLISDSDAGRKRIHFLTEGEASLHYAIRHGLPAHSWSNGEGIVIVDAGGGTVDVSAYRKIPEVGAGNFEEIAVPQCHFFGSVFVAIHAKVFITKLLADSPFLDDIDHIVERFNATTKLRFRSDREPQFIRFGGNRDNDEVVGIRYGQLKLLGPDVAGFFEPSITCIIDSVLTQVANAHNPVSHVVLVGGFASSDWLYTRVESALLSKQLRVLRPENQGNKAVSDGALSYYLNSQVHTRVSKYAYGEFYNSKYDPKIPEHLVREKQVYISTSTGRKQLRGSFHMMIAKNEKIQENKEYRESCTYCINSLDQSKSVALEIWCYRGNNSAPRWRDEEPNMFSRLCRIVNDLSQVKATVMKKGNGGSYYRLKYDYILYYEGVELKAQAAWLENGVERRSSARVVYDPTD